MLLSVDWDAFSGTREVDPRYRLDEAALDAWMRAHVSGYAGPLTVRQFKGGQSNPTYKLITPRRSYVLRRKPPGQLLKSAHAVDREFRVQRALADTDVPVARMHALCEDDAVIGSMFYVMDKVEGRVLWDLKLPGLSPDQRRATEDQLGRDDGRRLAAKVGEHAVDVRLPAGTWHRRG